mmetsp:Transcript_144289/g.462141  ORF Transcript_144289/g.462141 Transcript_144289/m.462141 type:complete len:358 (+) Transcript_144289:294-1367(+)
MSGRGGVARGSRESGRGVALPKVPGALPAAALRDASTTRTAGPSGSHSGSGVGDVLPPSAAGREASGGRPSSEEETLSSSPAVSPVSADAAFSPPCSGSQADRSASSQETGMVPTQTTSGLDELVHTCSMFRECSYDFVEEVLMQMRRVLYKPGQVIVQENSDKPDSMFFVHWGTISRTRMGDVCGEILEGQSFGEAVMLGILPQWQGTFTAVDSCMVSELTAEDLVSVLADHTTEAEYFHDIIEQMRPGSSTVQSPSGHTHPEGSAWRAFRRCASLRGCGEAFLSELDAACERAAGANLRTLTPAPRRRNAGVLPILQCPSSPWPVPPGLPRVFRYVQLARSGSERTSALTCVGNR